MAVALKLQFKVELVLFCLNTSFVKICVGAIIKM